MHISCIAPLHLHSRLSRSRSGFVTKQRISKPKNLELESLQMVLVDACSAFARRKPIQYVGRSYGRT